MPLPWQTWTCSPTAPEYLYHIHTERQNFKSSGSEHDLEVAALQQPHLAGWGEYSWCLANSYFLSGYSLAAFAISKAHEAIHLCIPSLSDTVLYLGCLLDFFLFRID